MSDSKKPIWPYENIVSMTAHSSGSWCKFIKGKTKYFGPIRNPEKALKAWLSYKAAQDYAAKIAEQHSTLNPATVNLHLAINAFFNSKADDVKNNELSAGQYARYRKTATIVMTTFGRTRPITTLTPTDFRELRKILAVGAKKETLGPVTLKNRITSVRTIFAWIDQTYGITTRYGDEFDKPSARTIRQGSRKRELFTREEILLLLMSASPALECFILLGINCAFGQSDCSYIQRDCLHLDEGYHNYPRGKTAVSRLCPLWPETIEAIKAYERPSPLHPELFFVTRFGEPWVREPASYDATGKVIKTAYIDAIGQEFDKLTVKYQLGTRGFYTLRHTFRSVADQIADVTAIEAIMGHLKGGIGGVYTQLLNDDMARLRKVTDHVHQWLFR